MPTSSQDNKIIIGSEEWCDLPELGIPAVKARVDSGAKTSSIHAFNLEVVQEDGNSYVYFDIHPIQRNRNIAKRAKALLIDKRFVKSSSGINEERYVISTPVTLNDETWNIEITLTNRDSMGYRMLLGREAMQGKFLVDPEGSFLLRRLSDAKARGLYPSKVVDKKGLTIALLASNEELYSNRRIMEAGEARGHKMIFVNVRNAYMNINSRKPEILYKKGMDITNVDAVIPRLRPAITFYGCAVVRQFNAAGAFCLNDSVSIARSRDKLRSLQVMSNKGIDMPITGFANSPEGTNSLIKMVGGAPLVIKLLEGTQGAGVVLAETNKAAESVINSFKSLKANFLVQQFIKESAGTDVRAFVVDGKVVGAMVRKSTDGDFRANIHLGATSEMTKLKVAERRLVLKATNAMGLKVAGVDFLRTKKGPMVLEVNSSAGLEGIERATGKDIASEMIKAIEKNLNFKRKER